MADQAAKENPNPKPTSATPATTIGAGGSGPVARTDGAGGSGSGMASRPDGAGTSTQHALANRPLSSTEEEAEELAKDLRDLAIKDPSQVVAMQAQLTEMQPFLAAAANAAAKPEELIDELYRVLAPEARYHVSKAWEVSGQTSTDPAIPRRITPTQQHLLDTIIGAALARATGSFSNPLSNLPRSYSAPSDSNMQKKYTRISYADAALFVDPDRRGRPAGGDPPGHAMLRDLEWFLQSHKYDYAEKGALLTHAWAIALKSPQAPAIKAWLDGLMEKSPTMSTIEFRAAWLERWATEVRSREDRAREQLLTGRVVQREKSMTDYVGMFRGMMLEVPHMHESDRIRLFIQGMDPSYRKWCACDFSGNMFPTLTAAITHALGIERRNTLASNAADSTPATSNKFQRRMKRRFSMLQAKRARSESAPMSISDLDSGDEDEDYGGAGPSGYRLAVTKVKGSKKQSKNDPKAKVVKSVKAGAAKTDAVPSGALFQPGAAPAPKKASTSGPPHKKPRKGDPNAPSHIHFLDGKLLKMKDVWRCYDEGYCFNCFKQGHRSSACPAPPKPFKDGR